MIYCTHFGKKSVFCSRGRTSNMDWSSWRRKAEIKDHRRIFGKNLIIALWQPVEQNKARSLQSPNPSENHYGPSKIIWRKRHSRTLAYNPQNLPSTDLKVWSKNSSRSQLTPRFLFSFCRIFKNRRIHQRQIWIWLQFLKFDLRFFISFRKWAFSCSSSLKNWPVQSRNDSDNFGDTRQGIRYKVPL